MVSGTLTASEYQVLAVGDGASAITPAEAALLAAVAQERLGFCTLGHQSVRLAQYVGLVNLGSRVLEILPKIGEHRDQGRARNTLLRLLTLAYDLPLFAGSGVGHALQQHKLLDVFVLAYLRELLQLVQVGLVRRYRCEEDDLGVVRGRLMLQRQVSVHGMRIDRLACRFDELTIDNGWNQVLKSALLAVRPWSRGIISRRLWLEMATAFDEVSPRRDALVLHSELVHDRQVHHYSRALRWAGWILQLLSPALRAGSNHAPSLLFDMNSLFEAAVAALLGRRAAGAGLHLSKQDTGMTLASLQDAPTSKFFRLRPDLVLRDGNRVLVLADTKWTELGMNRLGQLIPEDAHVYQLNAYASAYSCEEVALIYPWHEGLRGAHPTVFRLPDAGGVKPALHVVCVDVGSDELTFHAVASASLLSRLLCA